MSEINQENRKALIIGCGIAGPAVAMFLKKAGVESIVYESDQQPDHFSGLFLNVARNGLRVLDELNVSDQIKQHGIALHAMRMLNGKGKHLGDIGQPSGQPQGYTILRGTLNKILRDEAIRQGIPIMYGKKLVAIANNTETEVTVQFDDGTSETGQFLVACDGIHSRTRKIVLPAAPEPTYTGLLSFGGVQQNRSVRNEAGVQTMVFGKKAFFGYMVREQSETYWFGNMEYPGKPTRRALMNIPQEQWRRTLDGLYADDIAPIPDIIRSNQQEIGIFPIYDMPPVPQWHHRSVVLIGDAVHATSPNAGQGASMAVEDAMMLGKCIRDIPNIQHAFAAFQAIRRERVERIVKYSRTIGQRKHATNPVQVFFRDLMMPIFLKAANKDAHTWMYDFRIDWNEKVHA
ncbi:FAD-dependent oxidoreductase [Paenibacillus allorhizosphaerae]|uniref:FAD-dependent urate hydroxylase n=1 Tax=Paenibacillus allorhizosphaerae TaxID=2849866 RepID=A0ABN7TT67_9BACL|nr:FAD-dependent monooxygenase [Paenibacillus allorhizosphaerae]CAG7654849.1 FAD-dependent urate hydroxylase [Paenibacillus allorhizosphaerae]